MIDVFMIDPPWPKRKGGVRSARPNQGRALDYETMPVMQIFDLLDKEIFPMAAPMHAVFLWNVDQFLWTTEWLMSIRGYRRHARIVWDKGNGVAPAFTVRYSHEYLIWYYKPKLLPIAPEMRGKFTTVLRSPRREHSRKPDAAYDMVAALYPACTRWDIFSREERDGWGQWGDQLRYHLPILGGQL